MKKLQNRWSDAARSSSAAARLAKYGVMMGLRPWGDSAREAASRARAASYGGIDPLMGLGDKETYAAYGSPSARSWVSSASSVEARQRQYDDAFRQWWGRVSKTTEGIATFHALVAAAGGAAAGGAGAYRQASGRAPVAGASGFYGRVGSYVTGKTPVYDGGGVLSGWAKTGRRPYARAFNQPVRQPYQKAGGLEYDNIGRMIDPSTGRVTGRVRWTDGEAVSSGRGLSKRPPSGFGGMEERPYEFAGRGYQDYGSYAGGVEEYYRDMNRARQAGIDAAKNGKHEGVESALQASGYQPGSEGAGAFLAGLREGAEGYGVGGAPDTLTESEKREWEKYRAGQFEYPEGKSPVDVARERGVLYRGINALNAEKVMRKNPDGSLTLFPQSNMGGKTSGVSATPYRAVAWDYATRDYAGGTSRHAGDSGLVLTIRTGGGLLDKASPEAAEEVAFSSEVTIPAGQWQLDVVSGGDGVAVSREQADEAERLFDEGKIEEMYERGFIRHADGESYVERAMEAENELVGSDIERWYDENSVESFAVGRMQRAAKEAERLAGIASRFSGVLGTQAPGAVKEDAVGTGAYRLGVEAYREGRPPEEVVSEYGLREGTAVYDAFQKGWLDGAGLEESDGGGDAGGFEAPVSVREDSLGLAGAYSLGVDGSRQGMTLEEVASSYGVREGTEAYRHLEKGFNDSPGLLEEEASPSASEETHDPTSGEELEVYRKEYSEYLTSLDASWDAAMAERGLDPQGYPIPSVFTGGKVSEAAAAAYGKAVELSSALRAAVTSGTAREAARALGLVQGQWGRDYTVINQIPPELLGEFERGFAQGSAGYDYGIRPPRDRAGLIRRVNAFLSGKSPEGDDDDPVGGFWPEYLTGKNQDTYVERRIENPGVPGQSTAALLRAAMEWLGNAMAENDREGMNAAMAYMADTLTAVQVDSRSVIARDSSATGGEEEEEDGADNGVIEVDEDGVEVGEEVPFFEDSVADPNAPAPWDFERTDWFLKNRWSDAARSASAAARLAKYGVMMGLRPWGDSARAAAAAARGVKGGGSGGGRLGKRRLWSRSVPPGGAGHSKPVKMIPGKMRVGGSSGGGADWNDAVESYGENGIGGMTDSERVAIFEEIRERSGKGEPLTGQDLEFLDELNAFLNGELDKGEWKAKQDPEQNPLGFFPVEAYDDLIKKAEDNGDRRKARRLRHEKNEARKAKAREGLSEEREERRAGRNRVYETAREAAGVKPADGRTATDIVRDTSKTVWDLRKPNGGWEDRGGTPVTPSVYISDGKMYDAAGKYIGKAPKAAREGSFFYRGQWFDAKTGKAIRAGYA